MKEKNGEVFGTDDLIEIHDRLKGVMALVDSLVISSGSGTHIYEAEALGLISSIVKGVIADIEPAYDLTFDRESA